MKTIYKYKINPYEDIDTIEIPILADILCVQSQGDEVFIWALVDKNHLQDLEIVKIRILATGDIFEDQAQFPNYIGTFQLHDGEYVFHVFSERR